MQRKWTSHPVYKHLYIQMRGVTYTQIHMLIWAACDRKIMHYKACQSASSSICIHKHTHIQTYAICPWKEKWQVSWCSLSCKFRRGQREDEPSDPVSHLAPLGSTLQIDAFVLSISMRLDYCDTDQPALSSSSSSSYSLVKPFSLGITI